MMNDDDTYGLYVFVRYFRLLHCFFLFFYTNLKKTLNVVIGSFFEAFSLVCTNNDNNNRN